MDDDDPFSFIIRPSYCSPFLEELLERLPFAREQEHPTFESPVPSHPPPSTAAAAAVNVVDSESIRVRKNRSPQVPTPIEEPSPNQRFRASTKEVGECSKKRKLEIPNDIEIITIEDSDDEGEKEKEKEKEEAEEVQEVEIAEDVGVKRRRLLPLWARINQEAQNRLNVQKSKQRGDNNNMITIMSVLTVLAREEKEARLKLGIDDGTTGDFLETAMRRGVTFTKSK